MADSVGRGSELVLSDAERDQLVVWSGGLSRLALRARIVLACAEPGMVYEKVAADVGVSRMTVHAWRRRFAENRLAGLSDRERPGRPKAELVVSDGEREQLTRWARPAAAGLDSRQDAASATYVARQRMRPNVAVLSHGQFRLMNGGQANWLTPTAVSRNKTLPVGVIAIWSVNRPAMMKDRSPSAEHAAAQMRSNGHPLGHRGRPLVGAP
jgi:transposase-like protein